MSKRQIEVIYDNNKRGDPAHSFQVRDFSSAIIGQLQTPSKDAFSSRHCGGGKNTHAIDIYPTFPPNQDRGLDGREVVARCGYRPFELLTGFGDCDKTSAGAQFQT